MPRTCNQSTRGTYSGRLDGWYRQIHTCANNPHLVERGSISDQSDYDSNATYRELWRMGYGVVVMLVDGQVHIYRGAQPAQTIRRSGFERRTLGGLCELHAKVNDDRGCCMVTVFGMVPHWSQIRRYPVTRKFPKCHGCLVEASACGSLAMLILATILKIRIAATALCP